MNNIPSKNTSHDLDLYSNLVSTGINVINGISPFSKTFTSISPTLTILGVLSTFPKIYQSATDRILLRKMEKFLTALNEPEIDWKRFTEFTSLLRKHGSDAIEKLILIVNSLDNYEKCEIYGRLTCMLATKHINWSEYLIIKDIVKNITRTDYRLIKLTIKNSSGINRNGEEKNSKTLSAKKFNRLVLLGIIMDDPITEGGSTFRTVESGFGKGDVLSNFLITDIGLIIMKYYHYLISNEVTLSSIKKTDNNT